MITVSYTHLDFGSEFNGFGFLAPDDGAKVMPVDTHNTDVYKRQSFIKTTLEYFLTLTMGHEGDAVASHPPLFTVRSRKSEMCIRDSSICCLSPAVFR